MPEIAKNIEVDTKLKNCPSCGKRCITWLKHDKSFVIVCIKCRYHMGPYTRRSDAIRSHNRRPARRSRSYTRV